MKLVGQAAGSSEHAILRLAQVAHGLRPPETASCRLSNYATCFATGKCFLRSFLGIRLLSCIQLFLQLLFFSQLVCQALCLLLKEMCRTRALGRKEFPSLHCKKDTVPLTSRGWTGSLPPTRRKAGSLTFSLSPRSTYQPSTSSITKTPICSSHPRAQCWLSPAPRS